MYKRKPIKAIALLLTFCLLMTAFSGTAIQVQAEELGLSDAVVSNTVSARNSTVSLYYYHYYDPLTMTATKRSKIANAVSFANTVHSQFGVQLSTSTIAEDTFTGINDCPFGIDSRCGNVANCGSGYSHHKDLKRIADTLNRVTTQANRLTVLWTDRERGLFCQYDRTTTLHFYEYYCGIVMPNYPVIHIMNLGVTNSQLIEVYMSVLLAHETVHCHGYGDVYNSDNHFSNDSFDCLMDYIVIDNTASQDHVLKVWKNQVAINPSIAFCDACRENITIAAEEKYALGN